SPPSTYLRSCGYSAASSASVCSVSASAIRRARASSGCCRYSSNIASTLRCSRFKNSYPSAIARIPSSGFTVRVPAVGAKGTSGRRRFPIAAHRNAGPDELDDSERPGAGEEAVGAREDTAEREAEDVAPTATFERVHDHHERDGADAVEG